eukprot:TRINITY_DN2126_c0_g2_i3.p1 TRINITY_DN2126_c0_g2~~TRINITY_DN2126_c0_g2_i3.p1  ORF type:complete len:200 (-),score=25.36 TRINITY_DN2126_c0_g2_i3:104-703(-)
MAKSSAAQCTNNIALLMNVLLLVQGISLMVIGFLMFQKQTVGDIIPIFVMGFSGALIIGALLSRAARSRLSVKITLIIYHLVLICPQAFILTVVLLIPDDLREWIHSLNTSRPQDDYDFQPLEIILIIILATQVLTILSELLSHKMSKQTDETERKSLLQSELHNEDYQIHRTEIKEKIDAKRKTYENRYGSLKGEGKN